MPTSYDPPGRRGKKIIVEYPKGRGKHSVLRRTDEMFDAGPAGYVKGDRKYQSHIEIADNREVADATRVRRRKP